MLSMKKMLNIHAPSNRFVIVNSNFAGDFKFVLDAYHSSTIYRIPTASLKIERDFQFVTVIIAKFKVKTAFLRVK